MEKLGRERCALFWGWETEMGTGDRCLLEVKK